MVLEQIVGTDTVCFGIDAAFVADNDAVGIGVFHLAVSRGNQAGAGVPGNSHFHACAHKGTLGAQQRHSLPLHVGAHQGAVGVIVFQEGNEGCRNGNHLSGSHVHKGDFFLGNNGHIAAGTDCQVVVQKPAGFIDPGIGLGNNLLAGFARGIQVEDLVGFDAVAHHAVGRFNKAEFIDLGVCRHGDDKADVWSFRRLNGADTAVVGGMHVAHFKAGTIPGQAAGAQGRQTALVRHFGQGVGLVHELRQLACAEELLEHGSNRLGIDEIMRHQGACFLRAHALLDGTLHADQAYAVLVLDQLANQAHAAVAQMVNIVGGAVGVL